MQIIVFMALITRLKANQKGVALKGFSKEIFFLQTLQKYGSSVVKGIGDDCCVFGKDDRKSHIAYIANAPKSLVVGMDSFCEDIHFRAGWLSPYEIATKAFQVNYSDLVAMNATPLYALISVVLPQWEKREITDFVRGLVDFAKARKIFIIGGDTASGEKMQIHITLFGKPNAKIIYRDKIPASSLLAYTQGHYPAESITSVGRVLKSLLYPQNPQNLKQEHLKNPHNKAFSRAKNAKKPFIHAKNRFKNIILRENFVHKCAKFMCGGLDISDGIINDFARLSTLNRVRLKPNKNLYKASMREILQAGEVYEMLFAFNSKHARALKLNARISRIKVHILGKLTRCSRSYSHFLALKAKKWH